MDVIQLLPRLHHLRFAVGHAYLWEDPDGLTLVDTGVPGSGPLIADAIESLGHRRGDLRRLVLTHFHRDHIGASAEVAGWGKVTVYAHNADSPFIQGDAEGPAADLADWERPLAARIGSKVPSTSPDPVRVDHQLDDGDILDFGDGAQVVAAPGHTPGSIALHLSEASVLFTGDAIARTPQGATILGVFNADPAEAVSSFKRLANFDAEIACFGHGDPLTENASAVLRTAAAQGATGG